MPYSVVNKHADICIERMKIYTPLVVAIIGLLASGIGAVIVKANIAMGYLLISAGLVFGGLITSRMLDELESVRWGHRQAAGLCRGGKCANFGASLDCFPTPSNLHSLSYSLVAFGALLCGAASLGLLPGV